MQGQWGVAARRRRKARALRSSEKSGAAVSVLVSAILPQITPIACTQADGDHDGP